MARHTVFAQHFYVKLFVSCCRLIPLKSPATKQKKKEINVTKNTIRRKSNIQQVENYKLKAKEEMRELSTRHHERTKTMAQFDSGIREIEKNKPPLVHKTCLSSNFESRAFLLWVNSSSWHGFCLCTLCVDIVLLSFCWINSECVARQQRRRLGVVSV